MPGLHLNIKEGDTLHFIAPKGDKMHITADGSEAAIDVLLVQKSGNYAALEIIAHRDIQIQLVKGVARAAPAVVGG